MKKYIYSIFMGIMMALLMVGCHQAQESDQRAASEPVATRPVPSPSPQVGASPAYIPQPSPTPVAASGTSTLFDRASHVALRGGFGAIPERADYKNYSDNPIKQVAQEPLTTFSLDVDTGSYANIRRFVSQGRMPHPDAVRVEEFINYFPTASEEVASRLGKSPFAVSYEMAPSPWNADKVLLRLNVQAVDVDMQELPPANLVFLVDVSGSMYGADRLDLLQASLKILVDQMRPQDRISLVVYAGATRVVLEPTPGSEKAKIRAAIDQLQAGGSTAGAAGLKLAYQMAEQGFIQGSVNRILLATDGDFNVGTRDTEELKAMVTRGREKGITLSTLGFGTSNYNEAMMVQVADVGNGNYSYIDTLSEAQKVLQEEMRATLITVAQDVKAQIEFNPALVLEYRQIGYEKRQLRNEDFNNDKVDAGDIGAGKRVTVLYELTLAGGKPSVDALRYQGEKPVETSFNQHSQEVAFLKLRWKEPGEKESQLVSLPLERSRLKDSFNQASIETRFLAAVAAYGQKLRNNPQLATTSWEQISGWGKGALGTDPNGYRAEFVKLVGQVQSLSQDQ